jgi:hypothetical protein
MTGYRAPQGQFLDDDTMMRYAPSIFTSLKHPDRSDAYRHIPTLVILDHLRNNGFLPVAVSQSGGKVADTIRGLFARHSIRFRQVDNHDIQRGDLIPELLLLNAHDGSGAYVLGAGLFRIVCLNGLVAGAGDLFRVSVRHTGDHEMATRVLDASKKIAETMPALLSRVDRMRERVLNDNQRITFARSAKKIVPSALTFDASELLTPRRPDDMDYDAWTVMNVVQENVIRGGIQGHTRVGSIRRTSSIADVERDTHINRTLWDLAEAA